VPCITGGINKCAKAILQSRAGETNKHCLLLGKGFGAPPLDAAPCSSGVVNPFAKPGENIFLYFNLYFMNLK
jgi:hypothetical protein